MSRNLYENIQEVPDWVKDMDKYASNIFLAGFLINRIKDIPMGYVSTLLGGIAILSFACAYSMQCITSCYYDTHPDYFFDYRLLFQLQSLFGAIGSLVCILNPELWLPCLGLFVLANACWFFAEQFRLEHPTTYPAMPKNPNNYLLYTKWCTIAISCSTLMGLIAYSNQALYSTCLQIGMLLNYAAIITAFYYSFQADEPSSTLVNKAH